MWELEEERDKVKTCARLALRRLRINSLLSQYQHEEAEGLWYDIDASLTRSPDKIKLKVDGARVLFKVNNRALRYATLVRKHVSSQYPWLPVAIDAVSKEVNDLATLVDVYSYKILVGTDIRLGYKHVRTCMSERDAIELYVKNTDRVSIVAVYHRRYPKTIVGRALLWKLDAGGLYMDRIYPANDGPHIRYLKQVADSNGWGKILGTNTVTLNDCDAWPYMDTLHHVRRVDDKSILLANGAISGMHNWYRMRSQNNMCPFPKDSVCIRCLAYFTASNMISVCGRNARRFEGVVCTDCARVHYRIVDGYCVPKEMTLPAFSGYIMAAGAVKDRHQRGSWVSPDFAVPYYKGGHTDHRWGYAYIPVEDRLGELSNGKWAPVLSHIHCAWDNRIHHRKDTVVAADGNRYSRDLADGGVLVLAQNNLWYVQSYLWDENKREG